MSKVVTLKYPIEVGDQTIKKIAFRRPTLKEGKAFDKITGDFEMMAVMTQLLGSDPENPDMVLTPKIVDKIDLEDVTDIAEVVKGFLPKGRKTGEGE